MLEHILSAPARLGVSAIRLKAENFTQRCTNQEMIAFLSFLYPLLAKLQCLLEILILKCFPYLLVAALNHRRHDKNYFEGMCGLNRGAIDLSIIVLVRQHQQTDQWLGDVSVSTFVFGIHF